MLHVAESDLISGPSVPRDPCSLLSRIDAVARRQPDARALTWDDEFTTYAELQAMSIAIAAALQHRFQPARNQPIAVCMNRTAEFIATVLAIQRLRCVYVPMAPGLPAERYRFVLSDAQAVALVADDALAATLPFPADRTVCATALLADGRSLQLQEPADSAPHEPCYIAYTSGTTGQPKGAVITHAGISNRILWMQEYYAFDSDDALLCKCAIDFDPSLFEIFMPLVSGGRIVLMERDVQLSASTLISTIDAHKVTFLNLVPLVLRQILFQVRGDIGASLKHIVCGGEAWEGSLIQRVHALLPNAALYNGYGPTETSIGVTVWRSDRQKFEGPPPIGRPIDNVHVLVMSDDGKSVPRGALGELWIGGIAVSPGYVGAIAANDRFLEVTTDSGRHLRFYKSGDLVRVREDGEIVYVGRKDNQIKLNGIRVELEEIEAVALDVPGVSEAVANVETAGGLSFLALYFTAEDGTEAGLSERLQAALVARLKPQVVPRKVRRLDRMPTKANGKADRAQVVGLREQPA